LGSGKPHEWENLGRIEGREVMEKVKQEEEDDGYWGRSDDEDNEEKE
jgi:hypothetical protein